MVEEKADMDRPPIRTEELEGMVEAAQAMAAVLAVPVVRLAAPEIVQQQ